MILFGQHYIHIRMLITGTLNCSFKYNKRQIYLWNIFVWSCEVCGGTGYMYLQFRKASSKPFTSVERVNRTPCPSEPGAFILAGGPVEYSRTFWEGERGWMRGRETYIFFINPSNVLELSTTYTIYSYPLGGSCSSAAGLHSVVSILLSITLVGLGHFPTLMDLVIFLVQVHCWTWLFFRRHTLHNSTCVVYYLLVQLTYVNFHPPQ